MEKRRRFPEATWWTDASVPEGVLRELPPGMNGTAFVAWLGPRLAEYRAQGVMRTVAQAPSGLGVAELERVRDALRSAWLALSDLPQSLQMRVLTAWQDAHALEDWLPMRARLSGDLANLTAAFDAAIRTLRTEPSKRGRRPTLARDALLAAIAGRLAEALGPKAARETAALILVRCGIPAPANVRTQRRNATRGQKLHGKNGQ